MKPRKIEVFTLLLLATLALGFISWGLCSFGKGFVEGIIGMLACCLLSRLGWLLIQVWGRK